MSSPSSSVKPPTRHNSSWISRLYHQPDRKHHSQEQESLLVDDQPDSDVEAQEALQQPQSRLQGFQRKPVKTFKSLGNAISRNWKQILIACILTLLVALIALLVRFYLQHGGQDNTSISICTSAACVHAASGILYNLDPAFVQIASSKDPSKTACTNYFESTAKDLSTAACTDFNKLVCGGFDQRHDLRPDQGDMFTGTLMVEDSQTILRHILEGDASEIPSADRPNFEKLKADYDACMDEKTIQGKGVEPLKELTEHVKELFATSEEAWKASPVRSDHAQQGVTDASTTKLTDALLYMEKFEISAMVSSGVGADDKDPDTQVVFISPPRALGLPSKEYYNDTTILADYQKMAAKVMDHFFQKPSSDNTIAAVNSNHLLSITSSELAKNVVAFETQMAALTPPEEDMNDITKIYNPMTLAEVAKVLPQISFQRIITELAPKNYSADRVIVSSPTYLEGLSELLSNSSWETVSAFLVWKTIQRYASRIEDPAVKPLKQFNNVLQGKDPDAAPERWRICIRAVDRDLGWILSKFFVDSAFSPAAKEFGDQIVTDIKGSFVDFLTSATWMTEKVRQRSIKKVHAIDQKIGYPTTNPDIMDPSALRRYYKDVTISNTTFFSNGLQVAEFEIKEEWYKLGKPTRHDEWGMTVPTVNAYYNPAGNEIVFPAGIMQHPVFYDPSVPQYLSYGAFGSVSGHELSHAFDNTGSQYDESGRYSSWWDNETRAAFEDKTQCFVDQYAQFSIPGPEGSLHVNGKLTLGENVADAGGLHAAFSAWKKREKEIPSLGLPGLEMFTNEQLFFVSYANWWCGKSTKETAIQRIYLDPHAPKWARILGTMANSAQFKKAFNCPDKEPTCDLW